MKQIISILIMITAAICSCNFQSPNTGGTETPNAPEQIIFITEGDNFSPVLTLFEGESAEITWTFSSGETSNSLTPAADFGDEGTREQKLLVEPWSALRRINIGYNGADGGSAFGNLEHVDSQMVSEVQNLDLTAETLAEWCSSTTRDQNNDRIYTTITSLDFANFINIERIECYEVTTMTSINLANTPKLRRLCVETNDLESLDLSDCTSLEDLRGALNDFPDIEFGDIGQDIFHICIRNNDQFTNRTMFSDSSQFPLIADLFIWENNQTGTLSVKSTATSRSVSIQAYGNNYEDADFEGALLDVTRGGRINLSGNQLTSINLTGCIQINDLDLSNNLLDTEDVDAVLDAINNAGRDSSNGHAGIPLEINLLGNASCSQDGDVAKTELEAKGWIVYTTEYTGPGQINFSTTGDSTSLSLIYSMGTEAELHWSDGTVETLSGGAENIYKAGLGDGQHDHYVILSNKGGLYRFGGQNAGTGNFVTISNLNVCENLGVLYCYQEENLISIGRINESSINEYHLMGTSISETEMDSVLGDVVESGVTNGRLWASNSGTAASTGNIQTLTDRNWGLTFP